MCIRDRFHIGEYFDKSKDEYVLRSKGNGIYFFVIEGEVNINDQELSKRDGMGLWDIDKINFVAKANSKILLMEVPLEIN